MEGCWGRGLVRNIGEIFQIYRIFSFWSHSWEGSAFEWLLWNMLMVWASTSSTPHDNCHWLTTCWLSPLQLRNGWVMETEFPFTLAASQALWGTALTTEKESQRCFFRHCESLIKQNSSASTDLISRQLFSLHTKTTISNSAGHIILCRKLILCYFRPEKNVYHVC